MYKAHMVLVCELNTTEELLFSAVLNAPDKEFP